MISTANGDQYHLPCVKDILDSINFNKVDLFGISYIFKKKEENEFQYCYQGQVTKENKYTRYRTDFITDKFPPERYYIPSISTTIGGRKALNILIKSIISKLKL